MTERKMILRMHQDRGLKVLTEKEVYEEAV